jgi:hypothetical protein
MAVFALVVVAARFRWRKQNEVGGISKVPAGKGYLLYLYGGCKLITRSASHPSIPDASRQKGIGLTVCGFIVWFHVKQGVGDTCGLKLI